MCATGDLLRNAPDAFSNFKYKRQCHGAYGACGSYINKFIAWPGHCWGLPGCTIPQTAQDCHHPRVQPQFKFICAIDGLINPKFIMRFLCPAAGDSSITAQNLLRASESREVRGDIIPLPPPHPGIQFSMESRREIAGYYGVRCM